MVKLERLSDVGIFTRDQKQAKEFYTRRLGLKVRQEIPDMGYLALGTTKGGEDAALNVWQPTPENFGPEYANAVKQIGAVTGVGFTTGNLKKTLETLRANGVKVESGGEDFAQFWDPDGNVFFIREQSRPKVRKAGLLALDFVTVVTRDTVKAGAFFGSALGLKPRTVRGGEGEGSHTVYRVRPGQTSIMPFTPSRESYDDSADYDADMGHVGENTWIMFTTNDCHAMQEQLLGRGVRFKAKAETQPWGGIVAEVYDPDDNEYSIYTPSKVVKRKKK